MSNDRRQLMFQQAKSQTADPSFLTKLAVKNPTEGRGRGAHKIWTPKRRQQLVEMWLRGATAEAIATAIPGATVRSVYMARHYYQLPTRERRPGRPPRNLARAKGDKPKIQRVAFETSRLMEFCTTRELVNQTGHECWEWPCVILKELIDNALDAAEETEIAPMIEVCVDTEKGLIVIKDNGPGIPAATVGGILDYTVRVSSREAYVSPTRGAQGNALKTILPMGYVMSGERNATLIEAHGVAHRIVFRVDQIRQEPAIVHEKAVSPLRSGTRITVHWPEIHREDLQSIKWKFLQIASDFCWLNPHLTLRVRWNDEQSIDHAASKPRWAKWRPSDPTCPHWYDEPRLERYMAAHIARRRPRGREKFTVREFLSEFRGLTGTAKQKKILEELDVAQTSLVDFFGSSEQVNHEQIAKLLGAMKRYTKKVPARQIGVIGRDHLFAMFTAAGGASETFNYRHKFNEIDGRPRVIEVMFGVAKAGLQENNWQGRRRMITAVNWSAALANPFRRLGLYGEGLDAHAAKLHASASEPIITLVHLACPLISYLDRGKSSVVVE
jgi:hypothetical protein